MKFLKLLLLLTLSHPVAAQNKVIDSLSHLLQTRLNDSLHIHVLGSLANEYLNVDGEKSIKLSIELQKFSKKNRSVKGEALAFNIIGIANKRKGEYSVAMKNYLLSLTLYEKTGDLEGIANVYNNIGEVYRLQKNLDEALKYQLKALDIRKKLNDAQWMAASYTNLGLLYDQRGEKDKALEMHQQALLLRKQVGDADGIATSYNNIGNFYFSDGNYAQALTCYNRSLQISDSIGDEFGKPMAYLNIGSCYYMKKDYKTTEVLFLKALQISRANKDKNWVQASYGALGELYMTTGDYKKAYQNSVSESRMKDSLCGTESARQIAEMNAVYETEKKDAKIVQLNKDKKAQELISLAENKRKNVIIASVIAGLILLAGFALYVARSLRLVRKQKNVIEEQKQTVEEKQKEIIDSINYSKRLQQAILPPPEMLKQYFPESFLYYRPKDIVAGDFYFFEVHNNRMYIAAADCTGHGVPGAMVSVVCANALSRCVKEFGLTDPAKILDKTSELVLETFRKSGEIRDGMDISLCSIEFRISNSELNHNSKLETRNSPITLQFSGANNPLWVIRNEKCKLHTNQPDPNCTLCINKHALHEVPGDKRPVGLYENPKPFTTHTISINPGDVLYMFTDGYSDQFGGDKGKKMKTGTLKNYLHTISSKSMNEQRQQLEKFFENWKGGLEQLDDVCGIGIRI